MTRFSTARGAPITANAYTPPAPLPIPWLGHVAIGVRGEGIEEWGVEDIDVVRGRGQGDECDGLFGVKGKHRHALIDAEQWTIVSSVEASSDAGSGSDRPT